MPGNTLDKLRVYSYRFRPLADFYGAEFKRIYSFLLKTRQWGKGQIQEYKLGKIKQLIEHAEKNVPFYRRRFSEYGVGSGSIKDLDDLAKFPILTKDDLVNNFNELKAEDFEKYNPVRAKTAGTTGQITNLYRSSYHESFRKAVLWRIYNQFGYEFRQRRVTVDDPPSFKPDSPIFEHDKIENNLKINTYHLMAGKAETIYAKIREFNPRMIWGHPTFLAILGEYALKNGREPLEIPLIATYAEKIYPYTRILMHAFCRGKFIDYYGNKENTIAAWGHSDNRFYEVSEYCHFEVLPGTMQSDNPEAGDLITTSLNNYAFPLIRYLPGDIVSYNGFVNTEIPYPQIKLHGGRGKDLLLTRDGLTIPHLVDYLERCDFTHLRKHQIEQVSLDKIIVRIVPEKTYERKIHEPVLRKLAKDSTAGRFNVEIEYVDDIPLTARGKFPAIISKLAVDNIYAKLDSLKKL
jgi:phenylacetate-CoA ligase